MASGIVFLFVPSAGGFQGGRNPYFVSTILGMDRWFLKDLHTWSSIVMAVGVFGHLVLHWNWFVCMTRNFIKGRKSDPISTKAVKVPATSAAAVSTAPAASTAAAVSAAETCREEC